MTLPLRPPNSRPAGIARRWAALPRGLRWSLAVPALAGALIGALAIGGPLLERAVSPVAVSNGWIVFTIEENDLEGPSDVYVVRPGAPERALVGFEGDRVREVCPQFSPDGTQIAYLSGPAIGPIHGRDEIRIVTISADGVVVGAPRVLAGGLDGSCPEWSPDGKRVASLLPPRPASGEPASGGTEHTLSVVGLDSSSMAIELGASIREPGFDWSPDGTEIAHIGDWSIWVAPIDGGAPRRVYETDVDTHLSEPEWAPDGQRILVTALRGPSAPLADAATRIIHVDGRAAPVELTGFQGIIWSPDGQRLAAVRSTKQGAFDWDQIVTMAPDGRDVRVIADEQWAIGALTWSPDGSELVYVETQGPSPGLLAIAASGESEPRLLLSQPSTLFNMGSEDVSWQAVLLPRE